MARTVFKQRQWFHFLLRRAKLSGFTLIEVLVALIVGGMIASGLLFLVVQLLETNQRDAARSDTQRDIQSALDYIARDLREAVYVYDGECLNRRANYNPREHCPGLTNYLPTDVAGTGSNATSLPVLAFWRLEPLPEELLQRCQTNAGGYSGSTTNFPAAILGVPCLSQRMYTLVVYSLDWKQRTGMRGRARLTRYKLPQFPFTNPAGTPPRSQGWVSPVEPTEQNNQDRETDFYFWPLDKGTLSNGNPDNLQTALPSGEATVLVDFVDRQGIYDGNATCPQGYSATPSSTTSPRGFYVCVKGSRTALNQEVIVRIRGEAANRSGVPDRDPPTKPNVPVTMETRVLTRGVVNKTQ
jgi:prepilin-type N-terminal cleavage/methylation domain-containing protein